MIMSLFLVFVVVYLVMCLSIGANPFTVFLLFRNKDTESKTFNLDEELNILTGGLYSEIDAARRVEQESVEQAASLQHNNTQKDNNDEEDSSCYGAGYGHWHSVMVCPQLRRGREYFRCGR